MSESWPCSRRLTESTPSRSTRIGSRPRSFIGTESWAEYGQVVLQMAILDTLLSIEEKLERLTGREE